MRILTINHAVPFPPLGGGDLRTYHLVRALAKRHEVTVVGFHSDEERTIPPFPVETVECRWDWPPLYQQMQSADDAVSQAACQRLVHEDSEPWFVSWIASAEMEETLRRLTRRDFDLALIEHSNMARFLNALPARLPKVLDLHNVHTLMALREAEEKSGEEADLARREAERTRRFETWAVSRCATCLAVSGREAKAVHDLLGGSRICVVPNGVDTIAFTPAEGHEAAGYLLFTGTMDYAPNVEAVQHFVGDVLPLVRQKVPGVTFHIVGARPTLPVFGLNGKGGVVVHGQVVDMAPYFREASVVVVPLLHGGGTRLKILEAAACGKAIVTTALGMEGLDFRHGEELLVADSAAEFARAVVALLADPERRRQLGRRARRAAERYDWDRIGAGLLEIMDGIAQRSIEVLV